jgi:hypothetical protein
MFSSFDSSESDPLDEEELSEPLFSLSEDEEEEPLPDEEPLPLSSLSSSEDDSAFVFVFFLASSGLIFFFPYSSLTPNF